VILTSTGDSSLISRRASLHRATRGGTPGSYCGYFVRGGSCKHILGPPAPPAPRVFGPMDRYPRALGIRAAVTLPGGARNGVGLAPAARRATVGRTPTRRARVRGVTGGGEPARVCRPVATLGRPGQRARPCGAVPRILAHGIWCVGGTNNGDGKRQNDRMLPMSSKEEL